jgi:lipopolysaccharide transport system ATP-binding protein
MSSVVIQGEGLGKRYHRGVLQSSPLLRDHLGHFLKSPLSFFRRPTEETFWALRDIGLEVHEGEVLGLIGRNGAGKTTLLKILARITRPTEGWAEVHGRVGSLLEVGTGFHPELTGRENTFLSGAILGMSKRRIQQKFDEIVGFAELEKFIDTQVKHYSSGMYVRLAFAVAAHLESEILLVDEVLAVGDITFQKKCLGKMGEVARAGRTVVMVSHQLNQIRRLCHRVVWIDAAAVRKNGPTHEVVSAYESTMARGQSESTQPDRSPGSKAHFVKWEIVEPTGDNPHMLAEIGSTTVCFTIKVNQPVRRGHYGVALQDQDRQLVWANSFDNLDLCPGTHFLSHTFPMLPLRPGPYSWLVSLYEDGEQLDSWECLPEMNVATANYQHQYDQWNGILNMPSTFGLDRKARRDQDVVV